MCGRFLADLDVLDAARRFHVHVTLAIWNGAKACQPTDPVLVIIEDETRRLGLMRWGWRCDFGDGSKLLLHARSEGLERKRTFAEAFARRRAVVLLTAWLEPRRGADGSPRKGAWAPWAIIPACGDPVAVAALWQGTADGGGVVLVTTPASPEVAHTNDRMPALLFGDQVDDWLRQGTPARRLRAMLGPCSPSDMEVVVAGTPPGVGDLPTIDPSSRPPG